MQSLLRIIPSMARDIAISVHFKGQVYHKGTAARSVFPRDLGSMSLQTGAQEVLGARDTGPDQAAKLHRMELEGISY